MCGRYTISTPPQVVAELFDLPGIPSYPSRYNLAPTQEAPVVRIVRPGEPRRLDLVRWGLIPSWAKEAAIGNRMINARSEGVADKPAFRSSFRKKRCLVAADGFFEWKKQGAGPKQPYLIRRRDRQPFAFAGLWSSWHDAAQGGPLDTFTILTTTPNATLKPLHDRMPVILAKSDFDLWLDPKEESVDRLSPLLVPCPDDLLETVPVSRAINSPAHDAPDCIEPLVDDAPAPPTGNLSLFG
jgi:putative SOS response-associated peptidase YedK